MACPAIITGSEFLKRMIEHIDCQAQVIGSYGYLALGQPSSLASTLMTGLLTLFIALFGFRMMFGLQPGALDMVSAILKIGIVTTLAFSWPAFRTVIYDVALGGPAEIADIIQAGETRAETKPFVGRLQQIDTRIVSLAELGTGRNTGRFLDGQAPGSNFAGTALQDDAAIGYARLSYLSGVTGSLALLRIAAGLLLALTPLVAGLLLFRQSRGLFAGWVKGLIFTLIGSIGVTVVLRVEIAVLEPWLNDVLAVRHAGFATPSAPVELLAITLAFAVVKFAMIWLLARIAFYRGWLSLPNLDALRQRSGDWQQGPLLTAPQSHVEMLRAERISHSLESAIRREQRLIDGRFDRASTAGPGALAQSDGALTFRVEDRLGGSYRRSHQRHSSAAARRDER